MPPVMRALAFIPLLVAACAPLPAAIPSASHVPSPTSVGSPEIPARTASPVPLRILPKVALADGVIPMVTTFKLEPRAVEEAVESTVRGGIVRYLEGLDSWRKSADQSWFPLEGAFGEAVRSGLVSSAVPGVERKLEIGSINVERYLVKPWGTAGLADVSVTIIDRVVAGTGRDQTETGRLRLVGEPLNVVDGWDGSAQRWFNGPQLMTEEALRRDIVPMLEGYLRLETWDPTSPAESDRAPGTNTYAEVRAGYLQAFDRSRVVARWFEDVRGTIERFDTFADVRHGLATVKLTGKIVTVDAAGVRSGEPLARTVVMLFGNWAPEVIDEETGGVWMASDQRLATLSERDRSFG